MEAGPRNTAQGTEAASDAARDADPGQDDELTVGDGPPPTDTFAPDDPDAGPDEPVDDGPEAGAMSPEPEVEVDLRPPRRLRVWQLAPIVALTAIGSLMFAFPLAFEFGDGGAVVAMLGLLICACAAGWGVMAARRAGSTWPGLPQRGSGRRPDWRVIAVYAVVVAGTAVLAVWRVARLR